MFKAYLKWSLNYYLRPHSKRVICSKWFDRITRTAAYLCDVGCENDVLGKDKLIEMAHIM